MSEISEPTVNDDIEVASESVDDDIEAQDVSLLLEEIATASEALDEVEAALDEIDETLSDPETADEDDVIEFEVDEDESPLEVLSPLLGEGAASLAAARDLDGYDGPTYNLVDQDGNVIETLRADRPFGFELEAGQSVVSND